MLRAAMVLASMSGAFTLMLLWQLLSAYPTVLAPVGAVCDPFAMPGWLDIDLESAASARWRPFDPSCRPSHMLPEVRDTLFNSTLDDAAVRARLPWMVGRTLLKLGDSVDRFHVEEFCSFMGGTSELIGPDHPLSPGAFRNGRDELVFNATTMVGHEALSQPHLCSIPRLDFRLLSVFHYGLASFDYWAKTGILFNRWHYSPPAELADRTEFIALGIFKRMGVLPDIVEFSSLLWDMSHLTEVDRQLGLAETQLQPEQRQYYRDGLDAALSMLEGAFPRAHLTWRSAPPIECSRLHLIPCVRVAEARAISLDLIRHSHPRFSINPVGELLDGQTPYFADGIHPGIRFAGVWPDVILHRMQRLFSR